VRLARRLDAERLQVQPRIRAFTRPPVREPIAIVLASTVPLHS